MTINVWWREFDFISYLFKFLPVRPQYIRSIFAIFFREIFSLFFFANFLHYFFAEFSHNIFANFRISIFAKFSLFCETDWSEILRKNRKFSYFLERMKCENIFFCEKCKIFAKRFIFFTGNLILGTLWQIFTGNKSYNNTASSYQILFIVYICIMFWFYLLKAAKLNKSSTPGGSDSSKTEI